MKESAICDISDVTKKKARKNFVLITVRGAQKSHVREQEKGEEKCVFVCVSERKTGSERATSPLWIED